MSRLRELMEELCPNGVEYKKLGDVGTLVRGKRFVKNDFADIGVPAIHYGEMYTYYGISSSEAKTKIRAEISSKMRYAQTNDVIIVGAGETVEDIGIGVAWLGKDDVAVHDACYIFRHNMNPIYVSYLLRTESYHKLIKKYITTGKISSISAQGLAKAIIPVPPLEIQNEIVKLLDSFTELTTELTAELTAELTLRKKQYNFYRDSLLSFVRVDDTIVQTDRQTDRQVQRISKFGLLRKTFDVEWKTLGEVCGLKAGTAISASCIREQKNDVYKTPCYGGNGLRGYVQEVNHYSDAPLIGRQGALCGNVCFAKAPYYATEHAVIVDGKKNFNNRFLFHVLVNMNLGQYKTAGAQPGLSVKRLNKVKIAIPKLEIQNSIANILDRFDTLCNDLTSGLPAEIAARKKQYEHYRDRLLTFPRSKLEERS